MSAFPRLKISPKLFLLLALTPAIMQSAPAADPCSIECSVTYPAQARAGAWFDISYKVTSSGDCSGVYVNWWPGDGRGPFTWPTTSTYYDTAGTYTWRWRFYSSATGAECIKEGQITILACTTECTATVTPTQGSTVAGQASGTLQNCYYSYLEYKWEWGDGRVDDFSQYNNSTVHSYSKPGSYTWTMTARPIYTYNANCVKSGNISVGCLQIGDLVFCADSVQQSGNTYTLSGNVQINSCLHIDGTVTIQRDAGNSAISHRESAANTGTVSFTGSAWVALAKGNQSLLSGPVTLAMDGDARTLTVPPENPARPGSDNLGGVPLYVSGSTLTFDSIPGIMTMDPLLFIGKYGQALASVRTRIQYSGQKQLLGAEVADSNLTPGIIIWSVNLGYDYNTNLLTGTTTVKFPDLDYLTLDASLRAEPATGNCINQFEPVAPEGEFQTLGTSPFRLRQTVLNLDSICTPDQLDILFGTEQLADASDPGNYFWIFNLILDYQRPGNFAFASVGNNTLLGIPYGSSTSRTTGEVVLNPATIKTYNEAFTFTTTYGSAELLGILSATYQADNRKIVGKVVASLNLKEVKCDSENPACLALRTIVGSLVSLPYISPPAVFDLEGQRGQGSSWNGVIAGRMPLGPLSLPIIIYVEESKRLLSYILDELNFETAKTSMAAFPGSAERALTLAAPRNQVCFAVTGTAALPSIYLRTPAGQTITPANASGFPGVHYASSAGGLTALFRLDTAGAGRWVLGVDNLGATEVSFHVLAEHPDPEVQFTNVLQTASSVAMTAGVTPAGTGTRVDFYYSRSGGDQIDGIIASGIDAAGGSASTVWDTAGLPSGTYFLLAKAVDGKGVPAIETYGTPIRLNNGGLEAPAGLCGIRGGDSANLTWTPSASPAVVGYQVLYTDEPENSGYPYRQTVPGPDGASVAGLDPAKGYRFTVAAFDANGNFSLESDPVELPPGGVRFDINQDGRVDSSDYLLLANFIAENTGPFGRCGLAGDVNGDRSIDLLDLAALARGLTS